jgi:phosphoribosylformimino-5-aminoimidazole carboxamide ribotide isomerase
MAHAYLSVGSNQGDRLALLREAGARLTATPGIRVLARSSVYETGPVGLADQPWFLNQVLLIETTLDPPTLLDVLQQVEGLLGRTRVVRWGPRTIDVDLVLYDCYTLNSERLRIPHPELPRRRFVLLPLAEIDPNIRLPDGRHIQDLLKALGDSQIVRKIDSSQESVDGASIMVIIPAIDIWQGRCVRLVPGAERPEVVYADDPVDVAARWVRHGARWIHVVDLEGTLAGHPVQLNLMRAIAALGVPIQADGGFRTLDHLEEALDAGAARVLLGADALAIAEEAGRRFGERVAASLGVKEGRVAVHGWASLSAADPISLGGTLAAHGVRRIVYTDIARDGTLAGPDISTIEAFVRGVRVPVIAAGGVASEADLTALAHTGVEGVIVGRALHEGRLHLGVVTERRAWGDNGLG